MTQFRGSGKKHKSTKISLSCILSTLLALSISTLLVVWRFQDAGTLSPAPGRQPSLLQNQLQVPEQPPQKQAVQEDRKASLEWEDYMRTGRKPKQFNANYSGRKIPQLGKEDQEVDADKEDEDSLLMPRQAKHFSNFAQATRKTTPPVSATSPGKQDSHPLFKDTFHQQTQQPQAQVKFTSQLFDHPIYFLNMTQVSMQDSFSASWLQRREEFMDMPLHKIMICEDAAWEAWKSFPQRLRMTVDVLDFSVEHLSKWWKYMTFYNTPVAYATLLRIFDQYIQRGHEYPTPRGDPMLQHTLAMIAFQPYLHEKEEEKHHNLTVMSLAATVESLRRAQMGRVIVVGLVEKGQEVAQEAFQYLADKLPEITHTYNRQGVVTQIGHLEVGYARGSAEIARSKHLQKNIPRAVLYGTKLALQLGDVPENQRKENETVYVQEWLGTEHDPSYWKYLYLTEPDTLLQARASSIPQLKAQLDQGRVLAPHRLQPIPHESDLRGLANKFRYLNEANGFDNVWELDPTDRHDVCCDEHQGPDTKPGKTNYSDCGTWWYMCGFKKDFNDKALGDVHERLRPYQLMKLKTGTGLTLLSGNLFGRRCFPAKGSFCKPPYVQ